MVENYTPITVSDNSDPDKTDPFLQICPECLRKIVTIRACEPLTVAQCMKYTHLCINASGVWRWCGTFGSMHLEVFKLAELGKGSR